ncbi:hypothetical protein [Methylobacterium sp.]|uniref:hypothetical protein n=1 Tax=Methylobacterium sp. TaxID=409 RepID=UPI003B010C82
MIQSKAVASSIPDLAGIEDASGLASRYPSIDADHAIASGRKNVSRAFGNVVVSSSKA